MSDVLTHISSFLPPEHLVILSMVNKYMKLYVDVQLSNNFAETVHFCLRRYLFHCPENMRMTLNTNSGVFEGEIEVTDSNNRSQTVVDLIKFKVRSQFG